MPPDALHIKTLIRIAIGFSLYLLTNSCNNGQNTDASVETVSKTTEQLSIIYFVPVDQSPGNDYIRRISVMAIDAKRYFDFWMAYWKYPGRMNLGIHNGSNSVEVTTIFGEYKLSHYTKKGTLYIKSEIDKWFKKNKPLQLGETKLIFICANDPQTKNLLFSARGKLAFVTDIPSLDTGKQSTFRYIKKLTPQELTLNVFHELGHAFGLPHNWGNGKYNRMLGTALMGPKENSQLATTYLSKSDCAILNTTMIFTTTIQNASRNMDSPNILTINSTTPDSMICISGTHNLTSDKLSDVVFYNDCYLDGYGDNQDYDACSWTGTITNNNFSVNMPIDDFRYNYDTTYRFKIGLCMKNGNVKWINYTYEMKNGKISVPIAQ